MFKLRYILFILFVTGCDDVRIVAPPSTSPNFSPIGDSVQCNACGQRALELCQARDPDSYPNWFGFNHLGNCTATCSTGGTQFIGGFSAPINTACPYQVNTTLFFSNEICPSGTPERGDRDFWGHGPRFTGSVTAEPSSDGKSVVANITATWRETQSDFSTITLRDAQVAASHRLIQSPPFTAQETRVTRVGPARSGNIDIVMSSRQEEIISPADGNSLVEQLVVVGDTHADDISADGNCYDNARINSITIKPVRVTIEPIP